MIETDEVTELKFLKSIYGDKIPDELEKEVLSCGTVIYTSGKPNIKNLVKKTLALMS